MMMLSMADEPTSTLAYTTSTNNSSLDELDVDGMYAPPATPATMGQRSAGSGGTNVPPLRLHDIDGGDHRPDGYADGDGFLDGFGLPGEFSSVGAMEETNPSRVGARSGMGIGMETPRSRSPQTQQDQQDLALITPVDRRRSSRPSSSTTRQSSGWQRLDPTDGQRGRNNSSSLSRGGITPARRTLPIVPILPSHLAEGAVIVETTTTAQVVQTAQISTVIVTGE